ncbi:apolipo protein O-domain-containing protein [Dioszegia hungarica]|uniref:MICOS complex subunit n=1 Tax=Dioszegia hungarica TaxID=4972 RepID=A0AA38LYR6_9TREE|nr:apolipo protein O-domain-containing protein [Dioszegia hungarica]KAI9639406.1 apolipo protein O-domain-containing protein [Dioszegia hungarica]
MSGILLRAALPVAAVAGSALLASPVYAEDLAKERLPTKVKPGRDASGDRLPIYADPEGSITLIETTHPISPYIAQARESTQSALAGASRYVEGGVSRWVGFERKVEREVKSVVPSDEPLIPGAIYVLIAGLTGSVLTRTRAFPIRWLAPPIFTIAAAPYFLPKTSANIRSYLSRVEDAHMPELAREHDRLNARVGSLWNQSVNTVSGAGEQAKGWSKKAVQTVEDTTGLRVGESIRKAQEVAAGEVKKRVEEAKMLREKKVETVGYVVEQKPVAEIVRPVEGEQKPVSRVI